MSTVVASPEARARMESLLDAGMRPSGSTLLADWLDPGFGAECAWQHEQHVACQMVEDASVVMWSLAPEHDAWAQRAWSLLDSQARSEVLRLDSGAFGCWDGADALDAQVVDYARRHGVDLLVLDGKPVAGLPLTGDAVVLAFVAAQS